MAEGHHTISATSQTLSQETSSNGRPQSQSHAALCGVCNKGDAKYKCPRCSLRYCSVSCNKSHRENHPLDTKTAASPPADNAELFIDTVKISPKIDLDNPWRVLHDCEPLQLLFKKYPNLPEQLREIYAATLPPSSESTTTRTPGLTIRTRGNWTTEVGVQKGLTALRKARQASGEEGEAIREYSDLIVHLMYGRDQDGKVAKTMQDNRTQEERRFLEELVRQTRG